MTMKAIDRARRYSEEKLAELRGVLTPIVPAGNIVLTCGSYARREASSESDIDFYVIDQPATEVGASVWTKDVTKAISKIVPVEPAADGAFATVEPREALLQNIGGEGDSNYKITRRMLMLLEGESLVDPAGLKE